ncbi:MAG: ABC transporter ATP-binding protein [Acidobacteriota bacterium]
MKPVLETIKLEMVYRVGKVAVPALRGVDLQVGAGEYVAIMGPSGCGKSTFLHIVGGMLQPTAGQVIIAGEDITRMTDGQRTDLRRRKIGFVFQRFNLFPTLSAEGNLKLAERIHHKSNGGDAERRRALLHLLKLEDKIHHKPLEMSGGEQQRVALARAVINRPAILLADEPTGNLDSENSQIVLDMLRDLNKEMGQTIVMITHNPEAALRADRIIEMRDGHVVGSRQNP